jgi:hypothetical protein
MSDDNVGKPYPPAEPYLLRPRKAQRKQGLHRGERRGTDAVTEKRAGRAGRHVCRRDRPAAIRLYRVPPDNHNTVYSRDFCRLVQTKSGSADGESLPRSLRLNVENTRCHS